MSNTTLRCDRCGDSWDDAQELKKPHEERRDLVPISIRLWASMFCSAGGHEVLTAEWCRSFAAKAGLCGSLSKEEQAAGDKARELPPSERIVALLQQLRAALAEQEASSG